MSLSYGFYDSVNHDRTYNAEQFGKMFDGVILDGIFPQIGSAFAVTATSGLNFSVATGRAWFDHTWSLLEAAETMSVSTPDLDNPRIDTVVIEINKTSRTNSLLVVTGTPSSNPVHPELAHTEYVHQYPLADIYVPARATNLGAVTDRRGTNDCPYVRIVTDIAGRYVTSLNGETGDLNGVKSFNGQTGAVTGVNSVNGQTGIVNLVTGVSSVNGRSGNVIARPEFTIASNTFKLRCRHKATEPFTINNCVVFTIATGYSNIKSIIMGTGDHNAGDRYSSEQVLVITKISDDLYVVNSVAHCSFKHVRTSGTTEEEWLNIAQVGQYIPTRSAPSNLDVHHSPFVSGATYQYDSATHTYYEEYGNFNMDTNIADSYDAALISVDWDSNGNISLVYGATRADVAFSASVDWYIEVLEW